MGFLDTTDAEMIALTRQRRAEARARRPIVRVSASITVEFSPAIACIWGGSRRKTAAKVWRIDQWRAGNRRCFYCEAQMQRVPRHGLPGPLCVTVDHRQPLVLGGDDAPWNWALACWGCNNEKGALTEAEFRALRSAQAPVAKPAI